jgi:hypothetical protein
MWVAKGNWGRRQVPDKRKRSVAHTKQQLAQCKQGLHALRLQLPHQLQLCQRLLQRDLGIQNRFLVRTCCNWPERECTTASFILAKQLFGSRATALPGSSNCAIKPKIRHDLPFQQLARLVQICALFPLQQDGAQLRIEARVAGIYLARTAEVIPAAAVSFSAWWPRSHWAAGRYSALDNRSCFWKTMPMPYHAW